MSTPVVFVSHARELGGAERALLDLARLLDAAFRPVLVAPAGRLSEAFADLGGEWHPCELPRLRRGGLFRPSAVRAYRRLRAILGELPGAVVVPSSARAGLYAIPSSRVLSMTCIWYVQDFSLGEVPGRRPVENWMRRRLAARCTRVVAVSEAVARTLPGAAVRVIHNGIDVDRYARDSPDRSGRRLCIGMIGRRRPWKGHLDFLDAARRMVAGGVDADFLMVGGNPFGEPDDFSERLDEEIARSGLGDRLSLVAHLDDVREAHRKLDLFVHVGAPDPCPLAVLEAMAAGLPILAYRHGSMPELVDDGVTGRLCTPGDPSEVARAAADLWAQGERMQEMAGNARQRARALFSRERMAEAFNRLLGEVAGEAPSRTEANA